MDPALPITAHRAEVIEAIRRNPPSFFAEPRGRASRRKLPKLCVEAGRGVAGVIGHTQPRRISGARAGEPRRRGDRNQRWRRAIGYKVRFNDRTGPDCRIKLMTDGILLKELESDRKLRRYDTLIIDEAHERKSQHRPSAGGAQAVAATAAGSAVDRHVGDHRPG